MFEALTLMAATALLAALNPTADQRRRARLARRAAGSRDTD